MKCAAACIRISSVRRVSFATRISYQPGVFGSKNVMRQNFGVLAITCASRHETQNCVGWWMGDCGDFTHGSPGATLSQRVLPMITAAGPPRTWYVSRFGAATTQRVCSVRPVPDERESSVVSVFSRRNVFVARATIAEASGGGHRFGSGTRHVTGFLPDRRTSMAVGTLDDGAVAR